MFTTLKRSSPSISESEDICFSSSESLIRRGVGGGCGVGGNDNDDDDLILPPVSSFMKTCRPVQTILPSVSTLSDPEPPFLPSLHELHLLPEQITSAQPTVTTATTTTTMLADIPFTAPTSIVTTPVDESKALRHRKQCKRRPGAGATLTFSNSTTASIITTPSLSNRSKSFNLFDKSVEASVEGFGRAGQAFDDNQKSSLDLILLGEAAAIVENSEGSTATTATSASSSTAINSITGNVPASAKSPQRYSQEQDISMTSSLVPSNAGTPQPQSQPQPQGQADPQSQPRMPILTLPHGPVIAPAVEPPITVSAKNTVVTSPMKIQEVECAPKIRMFENEREKGGLKQAADAAFSASQEPRARRRSSAINKDSLYCHFCGRRNTPEWRKGPDGPAT